MINSLFSAARPRLVGRISKNQQEAEKALRIMQATKILGVLLVLVCIVFYSGVMSGGPCRWVTFTATNGKSAPMCVHPFQDFVSDTVVKEQRWADCDLLPVLWEENYNNAAQEQLFLDIGANIGSCTMEMLLSTNAKIVAFEPHPMNHFALQSTLQALDPKLRQRVTLINAGLGDTNGQSVEIFTGETNMGNSVLGMAIKDVPDQKIRKDRYKVPVERLDKLLTIPPNQQQLLLSIPLVKLDVQGYECHALEGFGQDIANAIHTIKFEVDHDHLKQQNCNNMFALMRNYGFYMRPIRNSNRDHDAAKKTVEYISQQEEAFDVVAEGKVNDFLAFRNQKNTKSYPRARGS